MSGHSKWSTIKRKKGANDAARGKVFSRLAREIQVAARGGADLTSNFALRIAVDRARSENMPKDNIERAIRRGAGLDKDAVQFDEVQYEGYGPNGVAVLVDCLTDNRNRTISDIRRCFSRGNGSLGEPGSVAWQFTSVGYIQLNMENEEGEPIEIDSDEIFMMAIESGAEDVEISEESVEIYTEHSSLAEVSQAITAAGFKTSDSRLLMKPNTPVELTVSESMSVMNLIDALEELDDVNNVYHNLEMTEELVAQFV